VAIAIFVVSALYLWIHLWEPRLPLFGWSYEQFHRHDAPLPILLGLAAIPFLTATAWRSRARFAPPSRAHVAASIGILWAVFSIVGNAFPIAPICPDSKYFLTAVRDGVVMPRWMLTLEAFETVRGWWMQVPVAVVIRAGNALLTTIAFVAMAGSARHLARDRREWIGMTLLCWTTFGNLQLGMGYIDVYPAAQMLMALYLYAGIRALDGTGRVLWPLVIAATAPFFYVGLSLLAPSALLLAWAVGRRDGMGPLAWQGLIVLGLAGLCTVPAYGVPFAIGPFLNAVRLTGLAGLDPDSTLLPGWYFWTQFHALEVASTALLVDGMGIVLLLLCGAWILRHPVAWFLAAVAAPSLVYCVTMDPLFGPYADWDLFSYIAVVTSLLGGYAFVTWGRDRRWTGALLGIVLAANTSHLLAKLNGLDLGFEEYIQQSPWHGAGRLVVPGGLAGRDPARMSQLKREQRISGPPSRAHDREG
jgi:hypothetical protein